MPKHITDAETWSVWSGDIEWKGKGGKADFRPIALLNGKRWGIIHPVTKRPQPPTEPRLPTNIRMKKMIKFT
jgi:hypothetical protein